MLPLPPPPRTQLISSREGCSIVELLELGYSAEEIAHHLARATGLSRQSALNAIAQLDYERRGEPITV